MFLRRNQFQFLIFQYLSKRWASLWWRTHFRLVFDNCNLSLNPHFFFALLKSDSLKADLKWINIFENFDEIRRNRQKNMFEIEYYESTYCHSTIKNMFFDSFFETMYLHFLVLFTFTANRNQEKTDCFYQFVDFIGKVDSVWVAISRNRCIHELVQLSYQEVQVQWVKN